MKAAKIDPFLSDAATVMALRLTRLPMMWLMTPAKADSEVRRMFSEKEDAWMAAWAQMAMMPANFWLDAWQGALRGDSDAGLSYASDMAQRRVLKPFRTRVSANKRRLSRRKGG